MENYFEFLEAILKFFFNFEVVFLIFLHIWRTAGAILTNVASKESSCSGDCVFQMKLLFFNMAVVFPHFLAYLENDWGDFDEFSIELKLLLGGVFF